MQTRILKPSQRNLRRLGHVLRKGGLVAIPTETVYGLAANALDPQACAAIFRAKERPAHDPLIVHVIGLAQAEDLAEFNAGARRLARRFWPGALTLVLPRKSCVPGVVTAGGNTVALRSPAHPLARRLLRVAGIPLAAPSANRFGYISPTSARHVVEGLAGRIGYVLDGGDCPIGVESTVLDLTRPNRPRILRPGAVTARELSRFLRRPVAVVRQRSRGRMPLASPGMLERHYSPRTPLRLTARIAVRDPAVAVVRWCKPVGATAPNVFWLSRGGGLAEMARNLYRVLRLADAGGFREICVEAPAPGAGDLADAIRDRLQRAATRR
ncbi:MAG TPA: L-threonylcarbamoyladenylate synthase [Lacunisphaera sp.]|nr:L-threonylcarbamoyladenylate synthase [Lacunisphaera sp.]